MHDIELANRQTRHPIDRERLIRAAKVVLQGERIEVANVSLAVIDEAEMHALNARHLEHDYPTDVLSFLFERGPESLEGEVIVSADYAATSAVQYGWSASDELALYVVHGTLHLCGYDDQSASDRAKMRTRETEYLAQLGIVRPAK